MRSLETVCQRASWWELCLASCHFSIPTKTSSFLEERQQNTHTQLMWCPCVRDGASAWQRRKAQVCQCGGFSWNSARLDREPFSKEVKEETRHWQIGKLKEGWLWWDLSFGAGWVEWKSMKGIKYKRGRRVSYTPLSSWLQCHGRYLIKRTGADHQGQADKYTFTEGWGLCASAIPLCVRLVFWKVV